MPEKLLKKQMDFLINKKNIFVVGVDGGGTKTTAALANLDGKIIKTSKTGSSNSVSVGMELAVKNISEAIKKVLMNKGRIISTIIGLPAVQERPELIKGIKRKLFKNKRIAAIFKGKFKIVSDQLIAFYSGVNKQRGVLLIAGTGCVVHGWQGKKQAHVLGWNWLGDEGSAYFIGQEVLKAVFGHLDGRGRKTLLAKLIFSKFKIKNRKDLLDLVYEKNTVQIIPQFSFICDLASEKGDPVARNILNQAGQKAALAVSVAVKKLNLGGKRFPLVSIGSVLKSKIFLNCLKKEIRKSAPKADFIFPSTEPVLGAVKLALKELKK